MHLRVERGSSVPLSKQIDEQIRAQCLSGILRPGDCLPSVRQLAKDLAVNVNTVFRVYERLAAEKFIEMRQGDGTYVLPLARPSRSQQQMAEQRGQYTREFGAVVRNGILLGITPTELRRMLTSAVGDFHANEKESAR
jgi:GntR family transcriptional regulator